MLNSETKQQAEATELCLKEVIEAAQEGLDNLKTGVDEEAFSEQTIDYLRGDAYELEQRTAKATQDVAALCDLAESEDGSKDED